MPNLRLDIPNNPLDRGFRTPLETKGFGIVLQRDIIGIEETLLVTKKLGDFINLNTAQVVTAIISHLLATSQPRVPVDTGKLRESGRAFLQFGRTFKDIARGSKDGTVDVAPSRISSKEIERATEIIGNVSYSRLSDDGKTDVALFTHEYLNYYGEESPAARQPGTGPKYLENAWLENKDEYISYLQNELSGAGFETALQRVLSKRTKRVRGYTLYYGDIVLSKTSRPRRF